MQKIIKILVVALLFVQSSQAQVTPVVSPAANAPKLVIPATFAGKLKLADSLQKLKTPTGVMLKTFLPQYSPQYQDQLIEDLSVIAKVQWELTGKKGYAEIIKKLVAAVRSEYPQITRASVYKIFYSICYKLFFITSAWGWELDDLLASAYGENKHYLELTGPKYLKEAKVDISTVFFPYRLEAEIASSYREWRSADTARKYSAQTLITNILRAGYTPDEIYTHIKKSGSRDFYWLMGFCNSNAEIGTPVETVARILKKDYISDAELAFLLSGVPGYDSPESLLKAQRAN